MNQRDQSNLDALVEAIGTWLPDPKEWTAPAGYPDSLALCVLDSIWSISVNYDYHVIPVVHRYRTHREEQGADPDFDGPADLLGVIDSFPKIERFCTEIATRHRTSSTNGILKAEAVHRACSLMVDADIDSTADLRSRSDAVKKDWHRIPGQRSGISWRYLLMNAGVEGIKADRMIVRFVDAAIPETPSPVDAERLMLLAADQLGVSARTLDHATWNYQRSV